MKAFICKGYGDAAKVLHLENVPTPTPKDHEIQIRIRATSVNSGDSRLRRADPFLVRLVFGFTKPKLPILGITLAGEVTAIGKKVSRFKIGDAIFGMTEFNQLGTFAEFVCASEKGCFALKPNNMTFSEAAALPFGGHTALDFLRKAQIKQGQTILIYGASGAVGSAAVQLAHYFGAVVTGVCSGKNVDLVKSLGAKEVVDYTKTPLRQIEKKYDIVFDTIGQNAVSDFSRLITEGGTLILGSAIGKQMLQSIGFQLTQRKKKLISGTVKVTAEDMNFIRQLAENHHFNAVIDKVYPFEEMIAAHQHVDLGRKRGNVIVDI